AQRKRLVSALIVEVEQEGASLCDIEFDDFVGLSHPELGDQVRERSVERSRHVEARRLAFEIAMACRVEGLSNKTVTIAADQTEALGVRHHPAPAARRLVSPKDRCGSLPLALEPQPKDSLDQLKGYALAALWPDHISGGELIAALTRPKRSNHFGPYELFLHEFPAQLDAGSLPAALDWARSHATAHDHMSGAVTSLLIRAW